MKIIAATKKDIERSYHKPTKYLELLDGFIKSGMEVAKIDQSDEEMPIKPYVLSNSLRNAIKHFGYTCTVVVRKNDVFLVKAEVAE